MANLSDTAYYSRLVIKFGLIAIVVLIVGRFLVSNGYKIYRMMNPPDAAPPTLGFGELPDIDFPTAQDQQIVYQLETPTGGFEQFPDQFNVYKVVEERPNLLALEKAVKEAKAIGFQDAPEQVSEVLYRWRKNGKVPTTLDMKIYWGTFVLKADWASRDEFLNEKQLPSVEKAVIKTKSVMNQGGWTTDDLKLATHKVSFLKAFGRELKPTVSLSEADFIQVDLFRAPIEEQYNTVTSDPDKGVIRGIISGNNSLESLIYLEFNYFPVDYERVETYPLITAAEAWYKLEQGEGYIARLDTGVDQVTVRRVGLGYYDSYEPQPYLQPVYIFSGDDNFVAYVPAATNEIPE